MASGDVTNVALQIAWELYSDVMDVALQITRELCSDGVQKRFFFFLLDATLGFGSFESFQGFFCLLLCTTDDDPCDVH
jgi:hypothetical protein